MTEIVRQLGTDRRILAVLTPAHVPTEARARPAPLGCILVNAGVIHRIGPHRFNVKLARHLAEHGVCSIRLDLSGRGDTPAGKTGLTLAEQAVADVRAAMDELQRSFGCERFVMFGICSGAVNAMDAALVDERLVGVCLYDGYAFPTFKTHAIRYWYNVLRRPPSVVLHSLQRRVMSVLQTSTGVAAHARRDANDRGLEHMPVARYREILDAITRRGGEVKVLYSGSIGGHYNHHGQFESVFGPRPFHDRVSCDYLPHLDHTLTSLAAQAELLERVALWCDEVGRHYRSAQSVMPLRSAA